VTLKRIIARLDIKGDSLVKGLQLEGLRKIGDPLEFAQKYYLGGADEILLVDVVASLYSRSHLYNMISYITTNLRVPVTVVGGIKTIDDARKVFSSGADKIGVNSAAIRDKNFLNQISDRYGAQAVVSSIEAKYLKEDNDWFLFTESGRNNSEVSLSKWLDGLANINIGETLVTSVDKDGMRKGPDVDLIARSRELTSRPLLYSGGITKQSDLEMVMQLGVDGVVLGSALHYGNLNIADCKSNLTDAGFLVRKTEKL
jgi:cyclase